jgi:hypothetical protein
MFPLSLYNYGNLCLTFHKIPIKITIIGTCTKWKVSPGGDLFFQGLDQGCAWSIHLNKRKIHDSKEFILNHYKFVFAVYMGYHICNALHFRGCASNFRMVWQLTVRQRTKDLWTDEVFNQKCSSPHNSCNFDPMDDCHTNFESADHREERDVQLDGRPTDHDRTASSPSANSNGREMSTLCQWSTIARTIGFHLPHVPTDLSKKTNQAPDQTTSGPSARLTTPSNGSLVN